MTYAIRNLTHISYMQFKQVFFPTESRSFPGKRWANVVCRSVHLCCAAVFTGGLLFSTSADIPSIWYFGTILSGLLMMGADIYGNGKYLLQNRGFFIAVKMILLGVLHHAGLETLSAMLIIIFLSGIISHAPARFRYYSLYHRREI